MVDNRQRSGARTPPPTALALEGLRARDFVNEVTVDVEMAVPSSL